MAQQPIEGQGLSATAGLMSTYQQIMEDHLGGEKIW